MTNTRIEETVIAYFDGGLTDAEGAELLHRVSVSPEIRELFQQHELLRHLAVRAARNVSVSPAIEEAVFANIAALQRDERRKAVIGFWSVRRVAIAAAAIALFAVGLVESLQPASVSERAGSQPTPSRIAVTRDFVSAHSFTVPTPITTEAQSSIPIAAQIARTNSESIAPMLKVNENEQQIAATTEPRTEQAERIQPPGIITHGIPQLAVEPTDGPSRYEIGIGTSSQTTWPGSISSPSPFSGMALHGSYAITEYDLAGLRFEAGPVYRLETRSAIANGAEIVTASNSLPTLFSAQAFYTRRMPIDEGRILFDGSIGGGFYSEGNVITLSAGLRLPVGEHFLAGATVSVTRQHQNGMTMTDYLSSAPLVIYDGADIHNTIIGRIEYGLSYRF